MESFDFNKFALVIGYLVAFFEFRQNRKLRVSELERQNAARYSELNEDREDIFGYYTQDDIDLEALKNKKPKDYKKIIHWEHRFFWHLFRMWDDGHVKRSISWNVKVDWDNIIKDSMKEPIHKQAWLLEIKDTNFHRRKKFNQLITKCARGNCDISLKNGFGSRWVYAIKALFS